SLACRQVLPSLTRRPPRDRARSCPCLGTAAVQTWTLIFLVGCSSAAELQPRPVAPRPEPEAAPVPAPGRFLHKKASGGDRFQTADGLVTPAGLRETEEAYYTAQLFGVRAPAPYPHDLREWKRTFGFPERAPGESLEAYRARANVAVYYNENELGLGRELA